tara:strand:- start:292 stop:1155 length:864 start_codon:yes stop_codon:yes gene_type:complete
MFEKMQAPNVSPTATGSREPTGPSTEKEIALGAMEQLEWAMEQTMKINHRKNKGPLSEKLVEAQEQLAKRIDELRLDAGKLPGRPCSATPRTSPVREKPEEPSWNHLPMLSPGKTYKHEEISQGFRLREGMSYKYDQDNNVTVGATTKDLGKNKIMPISYTWEEGGLAWMYWSFTVVNKEGYTLRECAVRYGMGGRTHNKRDIRSKSIFLDADREHRPGKCFIIAMDRPRTGGRVLARGQETNNEVVRIYRSNVPEDVQKVITLRDSINIRQGLDCPSWWYMCLKPP